MSKLEMNGPFKMESNAIDREVTSTRPGNYALGDLNKESVFIVRYVGRADSDLRKRIKDHLLENYSFFKFSYSTSPKSAFEKECQNYHDFGESRKLENKIHPDRPSNSKDWTCPFCNIYDKA